MPAPTGSEDIDWLVLNRVIGSLATQVFRVDTRDGQPPATVCRSHSTILLVLTADAFD